MSDTSLETLAQEIVSEHRLVICSAVDHAVKAGQLLAQAKTQVERGAWEMWLKARCKFSVRTAQEYMRLADVVADWDDEKRNAVAEMSLRDLLKLTAKPKPAPTQPRKPASPQGVAKKVVATLRDIQHRRDADAAFAVVHAFEEFLGKVNEKNLVAEVRLIQRTLARKTAPVHVRRWDRNRSDLRGNWDGNNCGI